MNRSILRVVVCVFAALTTSGPQLSAQKKIKKEHRDEAVPAKPKTGREKFEFPGMVINLRERHIDVESIVCLHKGTLELVACTKGSKEHESIVSIKARPMHIHAALLLLGADSGNPAMRKLVDKKKNRWVDIPPRGSPVDVFLVVKGKSGKVVERPISDFITRHADGADDQTGADRDLRFPTHTFLFAGSHLVGKGPGPRRYVSDLSGNAISIATFGDELLCLPGLHSDARGALLWQVDPTHLPAVGSRVTLRLRPQLKPASKTVKTTVRTDRR